MQFRSAKHATDGGTSRRFLDRFHTPRTSSKRRRAPMLEMLENRQLLAITSTVTSGLLSITGGTADTIALSTSGGDVQVNSADPGTGASSSASITEIDIQGGSGAVLIDFSAFHLTDFSSLATLSVVGGGGTDTFVAPNASTTFDVTGANSGNLTGAAFSSVSTSTFQAISNLTGGTAANDFVFSSGASLSGAIQGGTGGNTLDLSAMSGPLSVNLTSSTGYGFAGTASSSSASTIVGGFTNITTLDGPSTQDLSTQAKLIGESLPSTWTLNATSTNSTYNDGTHTLNFQNFQTLQAGNGGDKFKIEANTTANLLGGTGNNVFSFYGNVMLTGNITGGTGTNTLSYYDSTSTTGYTSNLDIALSYVSTNGYGGTESHSFATNDGFTNISNLIGNSPLSHTTQVDGIDSVAATWTVGGASAMSYQDTTDSGALLSIFDVTDLKGGTGTNTFNITASTAVNLDGNTTSGSNTNQFVFSNGAILTGNITGGTGASTNTLSYYDSTSDTGYTSNLEIALSGVSANGYGGTESHSFATNDGFTNISNLIGNSPSSYTTQVDGIGSDYATWTVNGLTGMSYQDRGSDGTNTSNPTLGISGVTDLKGGTGDNTFNITGSTTVNLDGNTTSGTNTNKFVFYNAAQLTGNITGGTGAATNTLSYYDSASSSGYSSNLEIALSGVSAHGYGGTESSSFASSENGFTNISNLIGNSLLIHTTRVDGIAVGVDGTRNDATWGVSGNGPTGMSYHDTAISGSPTLYISDVTDLMGGSGNTNTFNITASTHVNLHGNFATNDFVFTNSAVLNGLIDGNDGSGNAGTNTLDFSQYSTPVTNSPVTVTLVTSTTSTVGGTTSPISAGFSDIDNIVGNSSSTLVGEIAARTWDLGATQTYGNGTSTFLKFSGFGTLTGGSGSNTFNIQANTTANLNGAGDNNVFNFQTNGIALTGRINGGGTGNTVEYTGYTSTPVTMNLTTNTLTGTTGFSNLETLIGGNATSTTLVGSGATNTWTLTGNNQGNLTYGSSSRVDFQKVGNLTGGVGIDNFVLGDSYVLSGTIDGGIGANTLSLAPYSHYATVNITGANAGNVHENGGSALASFVRVGTLNLARTLSTTYFADTVAFSAAASLSGTLTGNSGLGTSASTLNYSAYTTNVRVNLGAGTATGVNGGISGFENVTGGSGNDILIGDASANVLIDGRPGSAGNDILVGLGGNNTLTVYGNGRNILIGGGGTNTLNSRAATGENLLIGGDYTLETNLTALNSLMAEWSRTGVSFATRRAHLNGTLAGGLNGTYKLITAVTGQTVTHDSGTSTLMGSSSGTGATWFIAHTGDPVNSKSIDLPVDRF